jgi:hypothetical protein
MVYHFLGNESWWARSCFNKILILNFKSNFKIIFTKTVLPQNLVVHLLHVLYL